MAVLSRAYIVTVAAFGAGASVWAIHHWHTTDTLRFVTYLLMAASASCLKVTLPRVTGTISGSFFLILLAITQLQLAEAILVGLAAMLMQVFWHATQPVEWRHAWFHIGTAALSVLAASAVYHATGAIPGFTWPLRCATAAVVYFLVNSGLVAGMISLRERASAVAVWKRCYLWSLPYHLLAAMLVSVYAYTSRTLGWELALLFVPASYAVYYAYRIYVEKLERERHLEEDRRIHAEQLSTVHLRTVEALASAIEAKDECTHRHLRRVQVFAVGIARELGLDERQIDALRAASVLHDIGKIAVPEAIITKPGKLTPAEFDAMKVHPAVGAEIVSRVRFPYPVAPIIRSHHERWDGAGYPDGLRGEEIPIGARILAVVDCFDALGSDRQYRPALSLDAAIALVSAQSGKAFDPNVVEVLERKYMEFQRTVDDAGDEVEPLARPVRQALALATARPATGFQAGSESSGRSHDPYDPLLEQARRNLAGQVRRTLETAGPGALAPAVEEVCSAIGFDAACVYVRQRHQVVPLYATRVDGPAFPGSRVSLGVGITGWVAQHCAPIVNGNPAVDARAGSECLERMGAALAAPIVRCGRADGVIVLYRRALDSFGMADLAMLEAAAAELYPAVAAAAAKVLVLPVSQAGRETLELGDRSAIRL